MYKKKDQKTSCPSYHRQTGRKGRKNHGSLRGGGDRPLARKPEKPWAGLTSYWLVYFFIGFHDFTCACGHFLGFVVLFFIDLSHFSLGDKKSWLLRGGGGHRPFPRKPEKISSPSDHLKSNTAFRNRAGSKQKWRHLRVYNQQRHSCRDIVRFQ